MTDTPKVTFDDIVNLGKKRVDDVATVEVPALGGSVRLRQLSGAQQDAAVALAQAGDKFDGHVLAREQIKMSLVEPELPADEADAILDNLPVQAFGELQNLVQANSGLGVVGVEELVAMFRRAADARSADGAGSAGDTGSALDEPAGVGSTDADTDDDTEGVLPSDEPRTGDGGEEASEAAGAQAQDGQVDA